MSNQQSIPDLGQLRQEQMRQAELQAAVDRGEIKTFEMLTWSERAAYFAEGAFVHTQLLSNAYRAKKAPEVMMHAAAVQALGAALQGCAAMFTVNDTAAIKKLKLGAPPVEIPE